MIHTDIDGLSFAVTTGAEADYVPGQPLGLYLPPSQLHFFDPHTGLRLDADLPAEHRFAVATAA